MTKKFSRKNRQKRSEKPIILICCCGEKTEPNYFKKFDVATANVEIFSICKSPEKIVDEAIKLKKKSNYDEVWVVFDIDDFPKQNLNSLKNSFQKIEKKDDIKIAYSNECIELWFVLHFEYLNTGIPRSDYNKKLNKHLNGYKKNDIYIYDKLKKKQCNAIKNAKKLEKESKEHPVDKNPSTAVYKLVEFLNTYSRNS